MPEKSRKWHGGEPALALQKATSRSPKVEIFEGSVFRNFHNL